MSSQDHVKNQIKNVVKKEITEEARQFRRDVMEQFGVDIKHTLALDLIAQKREFSDHKARVKSIEAEPDFKQIPDGQDNGSPTEMPIPAAETKDDLDLLRRWYLQEDVEAIYINRASEIIISRKNGRVERHEDRALSYDYIKDVAEKLAGRNGLIFQPILHPYLVTHTPEGFGITIVLGNMVHFMEVETPGVDHSDEAKTKAKAKARAIAVAIHCANPLKRQTGAMPPRPVFSYEPWEEHGKLARIASEGGSVLVMGVNRQGKPDFIETVVKQIPSEIRTVTACFIHNDPRFQKNAHFIKNDNWNSSTISFEKVPSMDRINRLSDQEDNEGDVIATLLPNVLVMSGFMLRYARMARQKGIGVICPSPWLDSTMQTPGKSIIHTVNEIARSLTREIPYEERRIKDESLQTYFDHSKLREATDLLIDSFDRIVFLDGDEKIITQIGSKKEMSELIYREVNKEQARKGSPSI